jgi:hypothetical protein
MAGSLDTGASSGIGAALALMPDRLFFWLMRRARF